jgi:C_GCAxxG_C_C family probable redox protein
MDDPAARARALMNEGMLCAESVLMAVTEAKNIRSELIPRIATGLCSGMARSNRLCGAYTGGVLAVSLAHGRDNAEKPYEDTYAYVQEFMERFEKLCGAVDCPTLSGCDLSTPEGRLAFKQTDAKRKCIEYAAQAAAIACAVIDDI